MKQSMSKRVINVQLTVILIFIMITICGTISSYAALNGGSNFGKAQTLTLGKEESGSVTGKKYFKFKTTSNENVDYKIWVMLTDVDWWEDIVLMDSDGNEIDSNMWRISDEGKPETRTFSGLRRNTTYYLEISDRFASETTKMNLKISEVINPPRKAVISGIKASKKKLTVRWDEIPYADEYQVKYRLSGKAKWKIRTITDSKITLKKLKSKGKYQIRVRGIRIENGNEYAGKWSSKKTMKTK